MGKLSKEEVLKTVRGKEELIRKFIDDRPTVTKSYDDLIDDIISGDLVINTGPKGQDTDSWAWDKYTRRNKGPKGGAGGWYQRSNDGVSNIYIPDTDWGTEEALPHELMHHFASHKPGNFGVPEEITKYQKLDMKHGGWLPSFHQGGRRPTLKGFLAKTALGDWWNKNRATKNVEYSDEKGYHPWFDEHAFDTALQPREKLNFKSILALALKKADNNDKDEGHKSHASHH